MEGEHSGLIVEESNENKIYNLEERLITYSLLIMTITEKLPQSFTGRYFAGQLVRSGTSPAFNYGEAQAAESRNDFIHKMRICLKELKESYVALQIIERKPMIDNLSEVKNALTESKELIAIFSRSIATAKKNNSK